MEKPKPLYNKKGQVPDPRVAERMAIAEDGMREFGKKFENRGNTQKQMDFETDKVGHEAREDLILEDVANEIKKSLSPEALSIIRGLAVSNNREAMSSLIDKIAEGKGKIFNEMQSDEQESLVVEAVDKILREELFEKGFGFSAWKVKVILKGESFGIDVKDKDDPLIDIILAKLDGKIKQTSANEKEPRYLPVEK